MPRPPRPITRVDRLATAVQSLKAAHSELMTIDLRNTPARLRNEIKEARKITADALLATGQVLESDVPDAPGTALTQE